MAREQWDHLYHSRRVDDPQRKASYRGMSTEAKDKLGQTWHIMSHVYSSAAGQSSYHYNRKKPVLFVSFGDFLRAFVESSLSRVCRESVESLSRVCREDIFMRPIQRRFLFRLET